MLRVVGIAAVVVAVGVWVLMMIFWYPTPANEPPQQKDTPYLILTVTCSVVAIAGAVAWSYAHQRLRAPGPAGTDAGGADRDV